ncbi:hypothetical protein Tco_1064344 [Tanacetum coccineum]
MQSPLCVENKVKIAPPNYLKENFAPQRDLTPEQIFWSKEINEIKKAETSGLRPLSALTVYPPNTPVKLVPRVLPYKKFKRKLIFIHSHQLLTREFDKTYKRESNPTGFKKGKRVSNRLFKEVKVMEEIFDQINDEVDQNTINKQYLEAEMSKVHNESKHISKLEREYLNLQLKYQHLQESFDNNKSQTSQEAPDFNSFFKDQDLEHQDSRKKDNVIRDLKVLVANVNDRIVRPYNVNDSKGSVKAKCLVVTRDSVKTKFLRLACMRFVVKPIPASPLKNNRSAHLSYIGHLKESVETELLEFVIGTCQKSFNERDNKAASTSFTRKKQVTFNDRSGTSTNNTQKHEVHQKVQQTNVPVIHSTGVNTSTEASGSKPRSNTKKNRILPAKTENKKKVEDHPRTNKSVWTKVNRVDSSISSKRVVINSNSESVCKTCNKCLNSASHEMCVVNILNSVNATPTVKIVLNKGKQIWKPKGKLSDNSLNKTKQVWKATGKLFANVGYQWRSTGKKFALGELCPLTKLSVQCRTGHPLVSGLRLFKTYDGESFKAQELYGKVHRDSQIQDHFGAIMGYGDYVMGDSVISKVYYVEGLGHNLFSVGQFCDSDL